jgi:NTP pyrophosphatase (non-canonical NTP hydrolase)
MERDIDLLIDDVINWGKKTGILDYSTPKDQALKTVSEVGEFADNVVKGRNCEDDIGDIIVTLILQCELQNTTISRCLGLARDEIVKRKGKMVNGVFVKEGDNG